MKTLLAIAGPVLFTERASELRRPAPHYWTRDGYNYGKSVNYGKEEFDRPRAGCNAQLALLPSMPAQSNRLARKVSSRDGGQSYAERWGKRLSVGGPPSPSTGMMHG